MKKTAITLLLLLLITAFAMVWLSHSAKGRRFVAAHGLKRTATLSSGTFLKLQAKAGEVKSFVQKNGFNSKFCFLVDMSLPSCQNRFFVFDIAKDSKKKYNIAAHGRCKQSWLEGRKYGNIHGCGSTSLGKYRIGNSYQGRFGLAFKLYGLDKTNDRAFERFVVRHADSCVPETEVSSEICQSDGCPMVSPKFLKQLERVIKNSPKPVLLWIFN